MKIALIALGSRGDVQPFIALALGLRAVGHEPRLLAAHDFGPLAAAYNLDLHPVGGRIDEVIARERDLVYDALDGAANPIQLGQRFLRGVGPLVPTILRDCLDGCRGSDLILASTLGMFPGVSVGEKLGLACYPAHMHPYSATSSAPNVSFPELPPWMPLRGAYNLLTHSLGEQGFWQLLREPLNAARRSVLGLPALAPLALVQQVLQRRGPTLYAYSSRVLARPVDWDARQVITGYWMLPQPPAWQPPAALMRFLAEGPPPVYVGFGSTLLGRKPAATSALIVGALRRAGQRGILFSTWGDLQAADGDDMFYTAEAPHDWLFPQVAAVVHHGGAGTTAAALHAARPAVVVPVYGDQQLWARRVAALGAGPAPLPRSALTLLALASAIAQAVEKRAFQHAAATIAAQLQAEDGVASAVAVLEGLRR